MEDLTFEEVEFGGGFSWDGELRIELIDFGLIGHIDLEEARKLRDHLNKLLNKGE